MTVPSYSRRRAEAHRAIEVPLHAAVELCRRGDWVRGLAELIQLADRFERSVLPALYYAYLGYGLAFREGRIADGLALCRHSLKLDFFLADGYLQLARVHLLARERAPAVRAVRDGLRIEPAHKGLNALRVELGIRREPLLSFLGRTHPINRALGRLRHRLFGSPGSKEDERR